MRRTDLRNAPETCDESNKSQKTFRSGVVGELFWYTTCSISSKRLPRGTMNRAMGAVAIQMVLLTTLGADLLIIVGLVQHQL